MFFPEPERELLDHLKGLFHGLSTVRVDKATGGGRNHAPGKEELQIDATLSQAELYVEQGLIRNAKRILENLRIKFPVSNYSLDMCMRMA